MTRAQLKFTPHRSGRSRHDVTGTWTYTVSMIVRGVSRVVLTDNTGGTASRIPASLLAQAELDVAVVKRLENAGHRLERSYAEVVSAW